MNTITRTLFLTFIVLVAAAVTRPADVAAQSYPSKPVRFIVPYGPGGGSDTMARLLAEALRESLGQQFVVENRPTGGSSVALEYVARSASDGYTIVISPNSISFVPALQKSAFDAFTDVAPIIMVSEAPIVIGGHPNIPVKNIREFIEYARANPGKLSYASCATGGLQHIAMESLKKVAGIDVLHIPYQGCGRPIPDMLAGRVEFYTSVMNSVSEFLANGQLRAYGISNGARTSLLPDVPTIAESGFPGFNVGNWLGIFAPAKTPTDVVAKLNTEFNKALNRPDIREKMTKLFLEPVGGTPEKLGDAVRADRPIYQKVLKDLGIESLD